MVIRVAITVLLLTGAFISSGSPIGVHLATSTALSREVSGTILIGPAEAGIGTTRTTGADTEDRVTYRPPVDRPIAGGFHLEAGQYGAGRRGLEYETVQGDPVRAAAAGIVTFAGAVAGRVSITVAHADGRRSTVSGMIEVHVKRDQIVLSGELIGLATPSLLLTLREGDIYVDPEAFLNALTPRARLVPSRALGRGVGYHYTLPSARSEDRAPQGPNAEWSLPTGQPSDR